MAETAEDVELVDGDGLKGDTVENECGDGAEIVAGDLDVGVLDQQWDHGVRENPAVHGPVWYVGHGVFLQVCGDVLVEVFGMDAQEFIEPVEKSPFGAGLSPPGGLHRVLWIAFSHDGVSERDSNSEDSERAQILASSPGNSGVARRFKSVWRCRSPFHKVSQFMRRSFVRRGLRRM